MNAEVEIIARGKADYFSKKGVYQNPYAPSSAEFNHYERGWTQSLKLDGARLVTLAKTPSPPAHQKTPLENRYAELKGRSGPLRKGPRTGT
jgi:hypothetical protein